MPLLCPFICCFIKLLVSPIEIAYTKRFTGNCISNFNELQLKFSETFIEFVGNNIVKLVFMREQ